MNTLRTTDSLNVTGRGRVPRVWRLWRSFVWLACVLSVGTAAQAQSESEWPLGRGDSRSLGVSPSTMPAAPQQLWEYAVPSTAFDTTPIIVDGVVYLGDLDGGFYAIDLASGKERWKVKFEAGFASAAAVQAGGLYVGDYDGFVRRLDPANGAEVWKFETGAQIDGGPNFYDSAVLVTSEDGSLYALEAETGALRWKYTTGDQLRCAPTVVDHRTFLGGCDGRLHMVDLKTGQAVGETLALDGPTGSTPAAIDRLAIAATHSGTIFAFDWQAGKSVWSYRDAERSPEIRSSPAVWNGQVFVTTRNKRVLALGLNDGQFKWEAVLKKRSDASPIVADGRIWLGAADGRVYAIRADDGEVVWQAEPGGAFTGSAAVAARRLVIANDKGSVFCFGEP